MKERVWLRLRQGWPDTRHAQGMALHSSALDIAGGAAPRTPLGAPPVTECTWLRTACMGGERGHMAEVILHGMAGWSLIFNLPSTAFKALLDLGDR